MIPHSINGFTLGCSSPYAVPPRESSGSCTLLLFDFKDLVERHREMQHLEAASPVFPEPGPRQMKHISLCSLHWEGCSTLPQDLSFVDALLVSLAQKQRQHVYTSSTAKEKVQNRLRALHAPCPAHRRTVGASMPADELRHRQAPALLGVLQSFLH